jgi:pyrimidine operon attenuation protein/uracil phosphoribosyltransferase
MPDGLLILDHKTIEKKIMRMSLQIQEAFYHEEELILAGIEGQGTYLAHYLFQHLKKFHHFKKIFISDIHLQKKFPWKEKQIHFAKTELKNKNLLIVDDVLNTGKTLFYALGIFQDIPLKSVKISVLVDRNHTSYPIKADITGHTLSTTLRNHVEACLDDPENMSVYLK